MTILVRSLIRILVLAAGLAGYAAIIWVTAGDSSDPNIGAGLLAMALVSLASGLWGALDGCRHPMSEIAICWSVVAGVYSVAWMVPLGVGSNGGMSAEEQITMLLTLLPMQFGQVLAPALVGALVARALRPASAPA